MQQMNLPALSQIQGTQVVTQGIDLHVAVGNAVAHLFRDTLAPFQDGLIVVGLDGQDVHPGELVPQIHRVRGKSQHIAVNPALDQEAQRLPGIVEGGEGHDIKAAHIELLHALNHGHTISLQGLCRTLAHVDLHATVQQFLNALGVVLVFVAHEASLKLIQLESAELLELAVGDPALQQNAGLLIAYHIGVAGRG